jgi:hypothetical protein
VETIDCVSSKILIIIADGLIPADVVWNQLVPDLTRLVKKSNEWKDERTLVKEERLGTIRMFGVVQKLRTMLLMSIGTMLEQAEHQAMAEISITMEIVIGTKQSFQHECMPKTGVVGSAIETNRNMFTITAREKIETNALFFTCSGCAC